MNTPLVSVVCYTYNHKNFIKNALDGILSQCTKFSIEVLVHDDASNDGTDDIIKIYIKQYPSVFKGFFENENQHSKGVDVSNLMFSKVKGKYIALCEGDDYWIDPYKLQKQIDFLEKNTNYVGCGHDSIMINMFNNKKSVLHGYQNDLDISLVDILIPGDLPFQTSTLVFRKELLKNRPKEFLASHQTGDFQLYLYLSLFGQIRCFHEPSAVYRFMVENSWSKLNLTNKNYMNKLTKYKIELLRSANKFSKYKFSDLFERAITVYLYQLEKCDK